MWTRSTEALVWAGLVTCALAACGGSAHVASLRADEVTAVPSVVATSTVAATTTSISTPEPTSVPVTTVATSIPTTPAPTIVLTAAPAPSPLNFDIEAFEFRENVAVVAGTAVTWTNRDSSGHDVSTEDKAFGSMRLVTGDSYTYRFERLGTFDYFCSIHPYMVGTIVVRER